ncbi:MAG: oligosaccharide flippase family protein [Bacilli bacterium]|nr:oligosaccharide flippase family protein [Bacilli bacterium]
MNEKKKNLLKNTIIIFLGKTSTQLISFFLLPLYTSYLTTKQYGTVDLIQTYVTLLVPIITLETEMSIFRYLVDDRGKEKDTKKLLNNNFYILFIALLLFSIFYFVLCLFVDIPYKFIIYIDIIVCVLSGNFLQVARGMGKNIHFSISCILTGITTIISNLILICLLGLRTDGMIISMALANFMCSLYLFIALKLYKYCSFKLKDTKLIKSMLKYSLPLIPNSISWWIINVSDRSIISWLLGTSFNGLYAISNKFPTILSTLLGIFNLSWSESSALHINDKDREEFFSDVINSTIKLFSCLGLFIIVCMPFVFPILINSKFNDAINYIPILIIAYVFNVIICLYSGIYIGMKKTKEVASTTMIGAVVNIVINLLLIKHIGLYAAALSTALAYFVMMLHRYIDLKKYMKITFDKKSIMMLISIFILSMILYYQNNMILNIINLVMCLVFSYLLNKNFIKTSGKTILKKFKIL